MRTHRKTEIAAPVLDSQLARFARMASMPSNELTAMRRLLSVLDTDKLNELASRGLRWVSPTAQRMARERRHPV